MNIDQIITELEKSENAKLKGMGIGLSLAVDAMRDNDCACCVRKLQGIFEKIRTLPDTVWEPQADLNEIIARGSVARE